MVTKRIIPCLDVRDGRVAKGVNFQGLRDVSDPVALAEHYSRSGADELVFYDITASHEGRKLFTDILTKVASAIFIPLTVGGGIRGLDDFEQCVVLSVDVKRVDGSYHVFLNGGRVDTGLDALEWVRRGVDAGAGEVVVNSMDTDGVKGGFDVELLKAVSRAVSVPVVASGGAGSAADFAALFRALPELSAGLAASIFHFGEVTIPALKRVLAEEGVCVRL